MGPNLLPFFGCPVSAVHVRQMYVASQGLQALVAVESHVPASAAHTG